MQGKRCGRGPEISWDEYKIRLERYRREMNETEMTINHRLFCIAHLEGFNLDKAIKINVEYIAQNKGREGMERRIDPAILRTDVADNYLKENQTTNNFFKQK